jgi:transposase
MLTREEDIDVHALRRQGMSISAIARHLGRDRKTIRAYLNGERVAGVRKPAGEEPFEPFVDYVRERLKRGSASVGGDLVRRGRRAGLRPVVSDVHPPDPHQGSAPALRALQRRRRAGRRGDRASAG